MTVFPTTKPVSRWEWLVPAAISAVLIAACVLISPKKPVWFDEVITWIVATDPSLSHMLQSLRYSADLAPASYILLAQLWRHLFGSSVLALRLLSALSLSGAVFASWSTLRHRVSFASAAYAHVAVFCASPILLYQDVELRSYGVFVALMALSLFLYVRLATSRTPSVRLLLATVLSQAALVLCHPYGVAYSAALLLALLANDLDRRSFHLRAYIAISAGWLAFLPALLPLFRLAQVGRTHSWTSAPGIADLVTAYDLPYISLLVGATCLVLLLAKVGRPSFENKMRVALTGLAGITVAALVLKRVSMLGNVLTLVVLCAVAILAWRPPAAALPGVKPLLYAAAALGVLPLAFLLAAQVLPPTFVPRYFLPTIFAAVIFLAAFFENAIAWFRARSGLHRAVFSAALISLLLAPLYGAARLPPSDVPPNGVSAAALRPLAPAGLPVVVEDPFAFLPLYFGHDANAPRCVYILNRQAANASRFSSATINFDLLLRLHDYGYLENYVLTQPAFLASNRTFLVLHKPGFAWFNMVVQQNPRYVWHELGRMNGSVLLEVTLTTLSPRQQL